MADPDADEQAPPDTPPQEVLSVEQAWQTILQVCQTYRPGDIPLNESLMMGNRIQKSLDIIGAELASSQAKANGNRATRRRASRARKPAKKR